MTLKQLPKRMILLGAAGIAAPLVAGLIAQTARAHAAELAESVRQTYLKTQAQAAELLEHSAHAPDRGTVTRTREHLERRRADSHEPALVIAELTAACRAAGANVEGVRPLIARGGFPERSAGGGRVHASDRSTARYQLIVRADYPTQARLMDACSRRRLPVRVVGFTIAPFDGEPETGQLRGEITVEAYQPVFPIGEEQRP